LFTNISKVFIGKKTNPKTIRYTQKSKQGVGMREYGSTEVTVSVDFLVTYAMSKLWK
jgi:hypothetical protein